MMIWLFLVWLLIGIVAVYKAVKAQHLIEKNRMEREQEKPTNQLAGASQAVSVSAAAPRPTAAVQQRTPTPPKAREEHAYEAYWHIFNHIECDQSLKERICSEYLPALLANEDRLCQDILEGELMLADWTWLWFEEWRRRFEAAGKWPNAWADIERQAVRRPASLNAALTFVKMHDIRRILKNKGLEKVPTNRTGVEQMAQQHLVVEDLEDAVADRWQELEANRIRYNKHAMIELIHRSIAHTFENLPVIEESERMGSPVVAYKDKLIAGKKVRRHEKAGNDLDMAAYEKIIRSFGQPDYELWDTRNRHLLLIYDMGGKAIKLAVNMTAEGAEVVSGFYVPMVAIRGAITGGEFVPL